MREEIQSGKWGRVVTMTAYNAEDWVTPNLNTWRHDPDITPGGFFYDSSGHQIDSLLWVTGLQLENVQCRTNNHGLPVPLAAWGSAMLTGGVPLSFSFVGVAQVWRELNNIHCERMDFCIENGRAYWSQGGKMAPMAELEEDETADLAFIKLLRCEGPNWSPPEEVWPVLNFTRAALESANQK